jgi:serine/threonine-protein kinase
MGHANAQRVGARSVDGRYQLRHVLAYGGMGTVWVAHDLRLDRVVALKFLARHLGEDPVNRRRFAREATATAQLQSRHVVQIFDYGVDDGTPYLVMERLEGEGLDARLRRRRRLGLRETADIVRQLAIGLSAAHERGLVHRDIKPSNVFLASSDGGEVVKLLDFGLAKAVAGQPDITAHPGLLGTPQYMSPEQVLCRPVDARSDVWSLGVLVFRMLTGRLPFDGTIDEVLRKLCRSRSVPSASAYVDDLPWELDHFFELCLAREPAERLSTVDDVASALETIADDFLGRAHKPRSGIHLRTSYPDDEPSLVDVSVSFEEATPRARSAPIELRAVRPPPLPRSQVETEEPTQRRPAPAPRALRLVPVAPPSGRRRPRQHETRLLLVLLATALGVLGALALAAHAEPSSPARPLTPAPALRG